MGQDGILIGQSREYPFLIVQGRTVEELIDEMGHEIEVYFNTFPKEGEKALEKYDKKTVGVTEEITVEMRKEDAKEEEEGWNQKPIEITIPIRQR